MNSIKYTPERIKFEILKEKVACLYLLEDFVAKEHRTSLKKAIKTLKEGIFQETGEVCYANYCPGCSAGECVGHSYNPKYCCVADENCP